MGIDSKSVLVQATLPRDLPRSPLRLRSSDSRSSGLHRSLGDQPDLIWE